MNVDLIANIVGVIALSVGVWALVRKTNDKILVIISAAVLLWGVHYFLMGSVFGGIMHVIAAIGIFTADRMKDMSIRQRTFAAAAFIAINAVTGVVWWSGYWDYYALMAAPVLIYSQFCLEGTRMRMGFMLGESIMFFYASALGSAPGMAVSVISVAAGAVGLVRIFMSDTKKAQT